MKHALKHRLIGLAILLIGLLVYTLIEYTALFNSILNWFNSWRVGQ